MKKQYNAPELIVHGNVEAITQAFGNSAITDSFISSQNNQEIGQGHGSRDGIVTPK